MHPDIVKIRECGGEEGCNAEKSKKDKFLSSD